MTTDKPIQKADALPQFQPAVVPVFDCHVILSTSSQPPAVRGRVANLPAITAEGAVERDVLMKLVAQFKAFLVDHRARQVEVPWQDPADEPGPGEVERWIPVHL